MSDDWIDELADRLVTAERRLRDMAEGTVLSPKYNTRVAGKAQGVNLALSYLREMRPKSHREGR